MTRSYSAPWRLTRGLVAFTWQARKASLYDSSLTPRAFSPLRPSASNPCGPPATRVLVSARTPVVGNQSVIIKKNKKKHRLQLNLSSSLAPIKVSEKLGVS